MILLTKGWRDESRIYYDQRYYEYCAKSINYIYLPLVGTLLIFLYKINLILKKSAITYEDLKNLAITWLSAGFLLKILVNEKHLTTVKKYNYVFDNYIYKLF